MDCVVCLCIGDKYTDEYVIKLKNMVGRNTNRPHQFICFSDRLIDGIDVVLIEDPHAYDPVWYKLWILQHDRLTQFTNKIFIDLDVVIHNNIDWVFDIRSPNLSVIGADWKPDDIKNIPGNTGYNSSVMVWSDARIVWNMFAERSDYYMLKYKGIDRFMWNEKAPVDTLPAGRVYSYREGASQHDWARFKFRPDYSICIFNQYPKPLDLLTCEPVKTFWI